MPRSIAIFGGSGTIGRALTQRVATVYPGADIHSFSRQKPESVVPGVVHQSIDYNDESSIEACAAMASRRAPLDLVIVATGILHDGLAAPEKSLKDLTAAKFQHLFQVNATIPALVAKHALPRLNRDQRSVFAALSARVGSVSDNRLGGWYAYRASKAALNMIIKTAAIEVGRRNKNPIVVGLHPGTVDSPLSRPFSQNVPDHQLFTPEFAARKLLDVIMALGSDHSGKCFAWDGAEIDP